MHSLDHLVKSLGFASYDDYLASPHWTRFKERYAKSGASTRCRVCGHPKTQLHHRTYQNLGDEAFGDVVPLCWRHHDAVHAWLKDKKRPLRDTDAAISSLRSQHDRDKTRKESKRRKGVRSDKRHKSLRRQLRRQQLEKHKEFLKTLTVERLMNRLVRFHMSNRQRELAYQFAAANDKAQLIGLLLPFEGSRMPKPELPERTELSLDEMMDRRLADPNS